DMKSLLASLNVETFILDLREPLGGLPKLDLPGITLKQVDPKTIELSVQKDHSLNDAFGMLSQYGILISSMRNKSNRLEELFVGLVEKNLKG
ncbi:MAG TPA: ABC transporter ATP-binding protein, partial [Aquirhabdus sp.]